MTDPSSKINFYFPHAFRLPARKKLKTFIRLIFRNEAVWPGELSFVFCDDQYLFKLNRKFLKHDFYTDVLSFPLSAKGSKTTSGEVYISVERVKENARALGNPFQQEIHRVIFHGVLHFCGHKDKSKNDKAKMRALEDRYLRRYFSRST